MSNTGCSTLLVNLSEIMHHATGLTQVGSMVRRLMHRQKQWNASFVMYLDLAVYKDWSIIWLVLTSMFVQTPWTPCRRKWCQEEKVDCYRGTRRTDLTGSRVGITKMQTESDRQFCDRDLSKEPWTSTTKKERGGSCKDFPFLVH
jgi:hypothetical protein